MVVRGAQVRECCWIIRVAESVLIAYCAVLSFCAIRDLENELNITSNAMICGGDLNNGGKIL